MAAPTRAAIERDIIVGNRLGSAMDRAGLLTSTDGTNSDLDSVLRDALVSEGIIPADPLFPADVDFAALDGASLTRFRIVAHLRAVEKILDAWDMGGAPGPPSDADKAFLAALARRRDRLIEEVRRPIRPSDAPSVGSYTGHHCGGTVPIYPDIW
jgi:hypothetical protein